METTNSTPRFTINNFKQEIKDLAKLQHDEKLFFKHPDQHPNFLKDYLDVLNKNYTEVRDPNRIWYERPYSQARCESRRIRLSVMYHYYYILKHWKKLNIDDDLSFIEYLENGFKDVSEEDKSKIIDKYLKKKYRDPIKTDKLQALRNNNEIDYNEFFKRLKEIPETMNELEMQRYNLLKHIDKEA